MERGRLLRAIEGAETVLKDVRFKADFWRHWSGVAMP